MDGLLNTDACTMPTTERPLRVAEFDALFDTAVRRVERRGRHIRMRLTGGEGLADRVRDLTERESSCCSFFTFAIELAEGTHGAGQELTLDISVPPAQQEILDALANRAEELST